MNTGQLGGTLRPLLLALALQPGFAQAVEAPAPARLRRLRKHRKASPRKISLSSTRPGFSLKLCSQL